MGIKGSCGGAVCPKDCLFCVHVLVILVLGSSSQRAEVAMGAHSYSKHEQQVQNVPVH